jgi:N utilization substance protein A
VVTELRGEKIDVVPWSADPATFVANALQPAKVREARVDPETQTALVIVPDYQLSLAIGREGQNARLAARLTGWRIDIKSETQFADEQRGGPRPAQPAPAAPAAAVESSPSSAQLASEDSGAAPAADAADGGAGSGAAAAAAGGDSAAIEGESGATTDDDPAAAPADTEPSADESAVEPVVVDESAEEKAEA